MESLGRHILKSANRGRVGEVCICCGLTGTIASLKVDGVGGAPEDRAVVGQDLVSGYTKSVEGVVMVGQGSVGSNCVEFVRRRVIFGHGGIIFQQIADNLKEAFIFSS